jgi:hypothetical protein
MSLGVHSGAGVRRNLLNLELLIDRHREFADGRAIAQIVGAGFGDNLRVLPIT